MTRELHLNLNITDLGRHDAAWRAVDEPLAFLDLDYFVELAGIAERGTLDAIFLSDVPMIFEAEPVKPWNALDPMVLLAALAARTSRIGLIATASSTFNEPYNLARRFASLDHLSKGRAAWNIVTTGSPGAAANFGIDVDDIEDRNERYFRGSEFLDIVLGLWDGWDDDALVADQSAGRFTDGNRIRPLNHDGPRYRVAGPLNVPRGPQGRPILVQAGASQPGKDFAARYADIVFSAQPIYGAAVENYADLRRRAETYGRDPDTILSFPGFFPVIGSTEAEAHARRAELDELLDWNHESHRIAEILGIDAETLELDQPLTGGPTIDLDNARHSVGFREATWNRVHAEGLTARQLILSNGGGHRQLIGTPDQIADDIEQWFVGRAADGFNVNFDLLPGGLEVFVDQVIPILRRRGLFRHEYTGTTLRENLGLPYPSNSRVEISS